MLSCFINNVNSGINMAKYINKMDTYLMANHSVHRLNEKHR